MSVFQEAMSSYYEYYSKDLMTAIPAVVVSVEEIEDSLVAVKPAINEVTLGGEVVSWPEIIDVPVVFPCSTTSAITFPIIEGDTVLLVFSMRGMDEWKRDDGDLDRWKKGDGGMVTPQDRRNHSLQDAIAIPGLRMIAGSRNHEESRTLEHSVDDLTFTHNVGTPEEAEVRIKPTGDIEITSPTKLIVTCPETEWEGNITLTGNITHSGDVTHSGNTVQTGNYSVNGLLIYNGEEYSLHTHTGVRSGSDISGPKS